MGDIGLIHAHLGTILINWSRILSKDAGLLQHICVAPLLHTDKTGVCGYHWFMY